MQTIVRYTVWGLLLMGENLKTPTEVPFEIQAESSQVRINTKGWCIKCLVKD
jgi:hypothetical protein